LIKEKFFVIWWWIIRIQVKIYIVYLFIKRN